MSNVPKLRSARPSTSRRSSSTRRSRPTSSSSSSSTRSWRKPTWRSTTASAIAFRALKEFADLCPDQDDIRLMLADQLVRKDRPAEAIEQLQTLYEKYQSEGRASEARATVDRMKALDPDIVPRTSGAVPVARAG